MLDGYGREIDYLRLSVTDKCNLRCRYCMPRDIESVAMTEILTFEEIRDVVSEASLLGIKKIKITGGEPLVRRNICALIGMIRDIKGIEEVTLTTNGVLLERHIDELKDAGIDGINISIDTLDPVFYRQITGSDDFEKVIKSIYATFEHGIPLKLNAVSVDPGGPDPLRNISQLIEFVKDKEIDVRFIELMPIGYGKDYPGIGHDTLLPAFLEKYKGIKMDDKKHGNGPAVYYTIPGYKGSVGFISAVHGIFCKSCNRIRLTTRGFLKTCLCYDDGVDLKKILRSDLNRDEKSDKVVAAIKDAILCKPKAHCFISGQGITENNAMSKIGG